MTVKVANKSDRDLIAARQALQNWVEQFETGQHHTQLGLERILALYPYCSIDLSDPIVITVAGTNGKGSTVKALESLYSGLGYRVGAYTSPHFYCLTERVRVANHNIDPAVLLDRLVMIKQLSDTHEIPLTFFEVITLAALNYFSDMHLDIVLLEVGLGGRLDAVNCVSNDCALITSIDYDHQEYLGDTLTEIAREKAGIIKENGFVISGVLGKEAQVINQVATKKGAQLLQLQHDFNFCVSPSSWCFNGLNRSYEGLPHLKLAYHNVTLALITLELLSDRLPVNNWPKVIESLNDIECPGRFEQCHDPFPMTFDVAHNIASATLLKQHLEISYPGISFIFIFSVLKDKPAPAMIDLFSDPLNQWFSAPCMTERTLSFNGIKSCFKEKGIENYQLFDNLTLAVDQALKAWHHRKKSRIVVFGSFYTVAEVKKCLKLDLEHT